jgi:hypothetical protein
VNDEFGEVQRKTDEEILTNPVHFVTQILKIRRGSKKHKTDAKNLLFYDRKTSETQSK